MTYIFYICIMIPALLSLVVLEKSSRLVFGSFLIGMSICLFTSETNDVLLGMMGESIDYFTTTISPIIEEVSKAIPILVLAFFTSAKKEPASFRKKIVQASFAVGLGFAVMENISILTQNTSAQSFSVLWALTRGLGAGLLHSVCTMAVGLGVSFVRTRKKFFYCGTLALLMLAITYHAIYNTIITSPWKNYGFALPLATYIPIVYLYLRKKEDKTFKKNIDFSE